MSKNKYKNNEPMNQKSKQPYDERISNGEGVGETHFGPDEAVRRLEVEEDPILLSEYANVDTEEPLPPLEHPEIKRIPDYREHVTLTEPEAIDFTEDQPLPEEKKHFTEGTYQAPAEPIDDNFYPSQDVLKYVPDSEDIDSRYYSEPLDPYIGVKDFDVLPLGHEDDVLKDPGLFQREMDRAVTPTSKGFPWWWILLPLILLALIYGLTRPATTPQPTPTSTTSFLPGIEAIVGQLPIAGSTNFIIL